MLEEFELYLENQIKEEERKLESSLNLDNELTAKKNNASLYLLKFIKTSYESMDVNSFKSMLENMDNILDEEMDSYLDITIDMSEDEYYISSIVKKSVLGQVISELDKTYID